MRNKIIKAINKAVFESISNYETNIFKEVIDILRNADFSGIPNYKVSVGTHEAFVLGHKQEKYVCDILNDMDTDFTFELNATNDDLTTEDSLDNLVNGDILVKFDKKVVARIDLKCASVTSDKQTLSSIDLNSILRFAIKADAIYLCLNNDGSLSSVLRGEEVYSMLRKDKCLYKSARRDRDRYIANELQPYANKISKECRNGKWQSCESDNVSIYDFIPGYILKKH